MRNPFKRRMRAPGASAEWDESEHIELGPDFVGIPEDQLPTETVERLTGVEVMWDEDGRPHVGVIEDAVDAELERWLGAEGEAREVGSVAEFNERFASGELSPSAPEIQTAFEAAVNNPENWVRDGVEVDPDARIAACEIDLLTGRLKMKSEPG